MRIPYSAIVIILSAAILSGCGLKEEEPEGVIPQGFEDAVHKADSVEGLLQDSKKKRDEAMDQDTQGAG
jgi:hypothetical protein